jgi:plasmid maintenance system antidote protein VapI
MRYILKENINVNFGIVKDYEVANRIGIHYVTMSNILNRKKTTDKPTAFYITYLCKGKEKDILKYFDEVQKGK